MGANEVAHALSARGLHHVAFATADLEAAIALWSGFGAQLVIRKELPEQRVEAAALELPHGEIELIAPMRDDPDGGPAASFLARRGPGLHHVALAVDDVAGALDHAAGMGMRLIDTVPRIGLHGVPIGFLHPSSAGGVLVELVQEH